jgi:AraC-like DNA-binding protein
MSEPAIHVFQAQQGLGHKNQMMSLWTLILIASVAIGLFLLSILILARKSNPRATYLFSGLLLILIATNFDNWLYASGNWLQCLTLVGFSRASVLLIGPFFYFYSKSVIMQEFRLHPSVVLHVVPYLIAYAMIFPQLYLSGEEFKHDYIQLSLGSGLPLNDVARLYFLGYLAHVSIYLAMTLKRIRRELPIDDKVNFIVPTAERVLWIKRLAQVFSLSFLALAIPLSWTIVTATYHLEINFALTTVYSLLIYYLGVAMIRREHLVLPGFARKYQSVTVSDEQIQECASMLDDLLKNKKIFLDPELTLGKTAEMIGIPAGYLSRYINEKYGKGFPDLINYHRVEELKIRLIDPAYETLTILGLAMEVGFNSKSSFNSSFRKFTGQSPSDYKKTQNRPN